MAIKTFRDKLNGNLQVLTDFLFSVFALLKETTGCLRSLFSERFVPHHVQLFSSYKASRVSSLVPQWQSCYLGELMRFWYLSHRRPAKAQASLRICAVLPEPSLFAHMKYRSRRRVRPKIKTSSPTGWVCMRVWKMSLQRTTSAIIT